MLQQPEHPESAAAACRFCNPAISLRHHVPGDMGTDLLLKRERPGGDFETMAALRAPYARLVDESLSLVCRPDAALWRTVLTAHSRAVVSFGGMCALRHEDDLGTLRLAQLTGESSRWIIRIPGVGHVDGLFVVTRLRSLSPAQDGCAWVLELGARGGVDIHAASDRLIPT